jgi:hypothetical protein
MALIGVKLAQEPVPPHQLVPDVPVALSRVVMRVLARNPAARPATAAALHEELVHATETAVVATG